MSARDHHPDADTPAHPLAVGASRHVGPPLDVSTLASMSLAELRALWTVHMGRAKPPAQKRILMAELAWRFQERVHGGLDAQTARLLNAAVRAAVNKHRMPSSAKSVEPSLRPVAARRSPSVTLARRALGKLPDATRLVRTWPPGSRTTHEVLVLEGGKSFQYRGKTYKSLSEVARTITGTRWSGPRFFGLPARAADGNGGAQ